MLGGGSSGDCICIPLYLKSVSLSFCITERLTMPVEYIEAVEDHDGWNVARATSGRR